MKNLLEHSLRSHDPAQNLTVIFFKWNDAIKAVVVGWCYNFDTGHLSGTTALCVSLLLLKKIDIKHVTIAIV